MRLRLASCLKLHAFARLTLYDMKILKAEYWKDKEDHEDGAYYFVHYKGWKQT